VTLPRFTWTDRARPIVQIGIGTGEYLSALWDQARWDVDVWAGAEPAWRDVTCDSFSFRCEYGRQRSTDRFVVGAATIVLWNATGWADPNTADEPGTLTMRPGRPIRVGVEHVQLGIRWLYRGFIDAMTPVYDPTAIDTVELSCVDALGEVNRAKVLPLDPPMYAGDSVDVRIGRLLDAANWPTTKRKLSPTGDTLIADDLGGQLADLLGQAADSGGGNVYGDLDGDIAYRARDWQTFVPGTPPDATIGNVGAGHLIPGSPRVDGWLNLNVGTVSTPDTPDMVQSGRLRLLVRHRVTLPASGFPSLVTKQGAAGITAREHLIFIAAPGGAINGSVTNTAGTNQATIAISTTALAAGDHTVGYELTPGTTTGATWIDDVRTVKPWPAAVTPPDTTAAVVIGQVLAGFTGRIYWAQLEAINRARLVFPGVAGNYLSVPDAAPLNIAGDVEVVARVATDWTPPTNYTIVTKDVATGGTTVRSWNFRLGTNGALGLLVSVNGTAQIAASSSILPVAADGAARWVKVTRVAASGLCSFYWAPDAPTEPTTWTAAGTSSPGAGNMTNGTQPVLIGARGTGGAVEPFAGRIARVIVRNGIAGTTVLDVSENNAGTMATSTTFVATSGQTVTVNQTAGNTIVQPQADSVVWRFDAKDWPGTGLSYVDPRGRTWTLSAAGAIAGP